MFKGTPEKLIEQLKVEADGLDTYIEDFLLTYRTFVKNTRDITSRMLEWCDDYMLRDKVCQQVFTMWHIVPCGTLYVVVVCICSSVLSVFPHVCLYVKSIFL